MNVPSLRVSSKRPKFIPLRTCSPPNLGSMGGRCFCCCQVLRSVEAAPSGAGFVAPAGRGRRKGAIAAAPPSIGRGVAALPPGIGELVPSHTGCPFCFLAAATVSSRGLVQTFREGSCVGGTGFHGARCLPAAPRPPPIRPSFLTEEPE